MGKKAKPKTWQEVWPAPEGTMQLPWKQQAWPTVVAAPPQSMRTAPEAAGKNDMRTAPESAEVSTKTPRWEIDTQARSDISSEVMKWFSPWVKSIEMAWWETAYVDTAYNATKSIILRKDGLRLTDKDWDIILGETPKTIWQVSEAIPQIKRMIYEEYASEARRTWNIANIDISPIVTELSVLRDKMSKMIWMCLMR